MLYTRTINYNSGLLMASISHLRHVTDFSAMSTTTRVQMMHKDLDTKVLSTSKPFCAGPAPKDLYEWWYWEKAGA